MGSEKQDFSRRFSEEEVPDYYCGFCLLLFLKTSEIDKILQKFYTPNSKWSRGLNNKELKPQIRVRD